MSYSISSWEIPTEYRKQFRQTLCEAMVARALHLKVILEQSYADIRALLPKDVGLKTWRTPAQNPYDVTTWINYPVPSTAIIGIYKIIQLSKRPKVTTMSFRRGYSGSTIVAVHQIENIYALIPVLDKVREYKANHGIHQIFGSMDQMVMEAYFNEPIIYDPAGYLQIEVTSPEGNKKGDRLMIGGFILEPRGGTVI